ncbi:MAG: NAD-dependent epimerase/dehydratase family protein, partial [Bacteroidetes bacterium]
MILVTGATGFTGGHLARRLVRDGHRVRVLVRSAEKGAALAREGMEPVLGDLTDPASLRPALAGVTTVYHIAAAFREEKLTEQQMWAINCEGVRHMLEAAIEAGTVQRFVHCSTIGVHGHVESPPATEDAPLAPGDTYQASKLAGEQVAAEYMRAGRLP